MSLAGLNVEAVRDLSRQFEAMASVLDTLSTELTATLYSVEWEGADAATFNADWEGQHALILAAAGSWLRDQGRILQSQADQQESASRDSSSTFSEARWAGASARAPQPSVVGGPSAWEAFQGAQAAVGLGLAGQAGRRARQWLESGQEAHTLALSAYQLRNLENARAAAVAKVLGDPNDMRVLRQYFAGQEAASASDAAADAARARALGARGAFVGTAAASGRWARGIAGVGAVSSVYDIVANPMGETGWQRNVSLTVDAVTLGVSGYSLAAGLGFVAVTPVGAAVIIGAGVVAAGWTVYQNWDHIEAGAAAAWGHVESGVAAAHEWLGEEMEAMAEDASEVIEGVAEGAEWMGRAVSNGLGRLFG